MQNTILSRLESTHVFFHDEKTGKSSRLHTIRLTSLCSCLSDIGLCTLSGVNKCCIKRKRQPISVEAEARKSIKMQTFVRK